MPTRRGRALLISGVLLYVVARFGSIGELYTLSAACLVFPFLALLFVRFVSHGVEFSRSSEPRRVFAGGKARVRLDVRNGGRMGSPPLLVEEPAPRGAGGRLRFAVPRLPARATRTMTAERVTAARGAFELGPLRARLVDPFGLAHSTREVAPVAPLLVYPAIEPLGDEGPPQARSSTGRSHHHQLAATGDEFYAVRDWQDGDDLRRIHWRSTARLGGLMIRQDEVTPFPRATIVVDTRAAAYDGDVDGFEWALSAAASIVWELARQGFTLRLATADVGPTGARWGREATDPLLTQLALAVPGTQASLTPLLRRLAVRPSAGGALLAIMPPPTADTLGRISRLRGGYEWCGAILLDSASFRRAAGRERAAFDQRLAEAQRHLGRAGWRVSVAGTKDSTRTVWQTLLNSAAFRPKSQSARS